MGPSRRVWGSAIVMTMCLGALSGGGPAAAQDYEASLRSLDEAPDPLTRSPRLLGMGRLTLTDDLHNRIRFWDFAGNPAGVMDAESLSTFEYRPGTRTGSAFHDLTDALTTRERQEFSTRHMTHAFEAWRRTPGGAAYGLFGELSTLQWDRAYTAFQEERGTFSVPALTGIVNSRVPWLHSNRFDFAVRFRYARETHQDLYFDYFHSPQGDYLDKPTASAPPPDLFTPTRTEISTLTGGVALAMRVTPTIKAGIGYDRGNAVFKGENEALRSTSRVDDRRPIEAGQATLVGRLGHHLEFGADGRAWRSKSQEFFFWSISAGPAQEPLVGDGKRLDRKEEGTTLRSRARWADGPLEFGASFNTSFRRGRITPWYPSNDDEPPGFNSFLEQVARRTGADTLSLPARVQASLVEERGYEMAGGGSLRLWGGRGLVGAEAHRWRRRVDQPELAGGPEPTGWDVRAGGEYRCNPAFLARAGWSYGISDRDDLTADDAYRHTIATTGFGYQAVGSRWSVDVAYAYEWVRPDFGDPVNLRENHQRLAVQSRWAF
jgi:hypothetical protein